LNADVALKANTADISAVGFSNDYNDLDNLPTIPTATSDLTNDSGFITIGDVPAQVNSDWNATSGIAQILNKPTLTNGTVTAVTATAPMSSTGGATPNLSMSSANGTTNGYLLSSDWLIFNGKFNTPTGTTLQYVRGDGSLATFPTITSGTVTSVAALTLGTSGADLSSTVANGTTTPVITLNVPTASATNRGALSSIDWSTFNGKFTLPSLTSGSVLFSNGTTIAQDNTAFSWDNTNKRLSLFSTGDNLLNLTPQASGNAIVFNNSSYIKWGTVAYMRGFSTATLFSVLNSGYTNVFNIGTTAACYVNTGSNFLIGTTTDAGFKLDVNGTARVLGASGATATLKINTVNRANGMSLRYSDASDVGSIVYNNIFYLTKNDGTFPFYITSTSNVLINTITDVASSQLTVESTTKGFLPPRMTTTQKNAIASPATGLVIFDTTLNKLCVRGASAWETITSV
jgi:hypothetical protein